MHKVVWGSAGRASTLLRMQLQQQVCGGPRRDWTAAVHRLGITCVLVIPLRGSSRKDVHQTCQAQWTACWAPLLWSLCAGGNPGPRRLACQLTSPDAQCSRRHSSSSAAPCSRLPARQHCKCKSPALFILLSFSSRVIDRSNRLDLSR